MNHEHTADYQYIDSALKSRWQPFCELEAEMASFEPRPLSGFDERRAVELDNFRRYNPNKSDEEILEYVDKTIAFMAQSHIQFANKFTKRFMVEYVTVIFLAHAICEALINAYLAIGLSEVGLQDKFSSLERKSFLDKWCQVPKKIFPTYEFPHGGELYKTLLYLTEQRNAYTHYKIELKVNDKTVTKGSVPKSIEFFEGIEWLKRCFSLPYDLEEFAVREFKRPPIFRLLNRGPIKQVDVHNH